MKSRASEIVLSVVVITVLGTLIWVSASRQRDRLAPADGHAAADAVSEDFTSFGVDGDEMRHRADLWHQSDRAGELIRLPSYLQLEQSLAELGRARGELLRQSSASSVKVDDLVTAAAAYRQALLASQTHSKKLQSLVTEKEWHLCLAELAGRASDWADSRASLEMELTLGEG